MGHSRQQTQYLRSGLIATTADISDRRQHRGRRFLLRPASSVDHQRREDGRTACGVVSGLPANRIIRSSRNDRRRRCFNNGGASSLVFYNNHLLTADIVIPAQAGLHASRRLPRPYQPRTLLIHRTVPGLKAPAHNRLAWNPSARGRRQNGSHLNASEL